MESAGTFASVSVFALEVGEIEVGLDVVKPRKVTGSVVISCITRGLGTVVTEPDVEARDWSRCR